MKKSAAFFMIIIIAVSAISVMPALSQDDGGPVQGRYACKTDLIEVLFAPETKVRLRDGEPVDLGASKGVAGVAEALDRVAPYNWYRPTDIPEKTIDEWQARGEEKSGTPVYNLNNMYRLRVTPSVDIWSVCAELEALPGIMNARPMPLPTPPPQMYPYDYESQQGYLYPASNTPTGIDAHYAWGELGGMGDGVTVCDIEYSWNFSHADLTQLPGSQINPNPILDPNPLGRAHHGTMVAGVLVSDDNGWGTTGICHMSNILTCGSYFIIVIDPPDTVWDVPAAMMYAINNLNAGDVILLEQQWDYNDTNTVNMADFIPIEWWTDYHNSPQSLNGVFGAIQNAISNGIHVIEAGGNGYYNTDNLTWFGNSGAIIVGAGGAYPGGTWTEGDLEKLSFSSYGTRYNLQGWGENVVTTGKGDLDSSWGYNYMYTNSFDGTSSASPVVAGAVACCVGYWIGQGLSPSSLTPALLRDILVTTGTPQVTPPMGHIGPRPNLQAAFAALTVEWTDVTASPIDNYDQHALGSAWGDYDGDGFLDIYVSNNNNPNKLFRNTGPNFVDASGAPVNDPNVGYGVAWGDYDNDGDLDLYLANNAAPNKLFRNDGGGVFTDVTSSPIDDPPGASSHVSWVDYDNDGDIDLYVTSLGTPDYLFRNDGGGSFADVSSGTPLGYFGASGGADWGDYDNDGDMDVYLACYYGEANHLFRNDGGTFTDVTVAPLNDIGEGIGVAWGDYDNDGDLDLYVVNNSAQPNKMFENKGTYFVDASVPPLNDAGSGISAGWADYDNDGDLDLFVTNGFSPNKLFRNDGPGLFVDNTTAVITDNGYGFGFSWGDYDSDGDLDIYLPNAGMWETCKLYRNEIGDNNHWFKVDLIGVISNRNGIGARVYVYVGGNYQFRDVTSGSGFCSMHSLTAEFGVGATTWIDSLVVDWPSGTHQAIVGVNVDNHIQLTEPTGPAVCGDANGDGSVSISDAVYIINYVFKGGPAPVPLCVGDANYDGSVSVSDAVYIINYVFKGGPAPNPNCCAK